MKILIVGLILIASVLQADKLVCYATSLKVQGKNISLGAKNNRARVSVYYINHQRLIKGKLELKKVHPHEFVGGGFRMVYNEPQLITIKDNIILVSECTRYESY